MQAPWRVIAVQTVFLIAWISVPGPAGAVDALQCDAGMCRTVDVDDAVCNLQKPLPVKVAALCKGVPNVRGLVCQTTIICYAADDPVQPGFNGDCGATQASACELLDANRVNCAVAAGDCNDIHDVCSQAVLEAGCWVGQLDPYVGAAGGSPDTVDSYYVDLYPGPHEFAMTQAVGYPHDYTMCLYPPAQGVVADPVFQIVAGAVLETVRLQLEISGRVYVNIVYGQTCPSDFDAAAPAAAPEQASGPGLPPIGPGTAQAMCYPTCVAASALAYCIGYFTYAH